MGGAASLMADIKPLHRDIRHHRPMFKRLGFSNWGANGIHKLFLQIDEDGSGEISIREFLKFFDLDRTKFSKRVFAIFDADASGELDFKELAMSIWNYCTLNVHTLMTFAFDLYDTDSSGSIDADEMLAVVEEVYGKTAAQNSQYAQRIIGLINRDMKFSGREIDKAAFCRFCTKRKALLFPAFMMQDTLRQQIMGRKFWDEMSVRRAEITEHGKVDIMIVINSITREEFDQMVAGGDDAQDAADAAAVASAGSSVVASKRSVAARAAVQVKKRRSTADVEAKRKAQAEALRRQQSVVLEKGKYAFPARPNAERSEKLRKKKAKREAKKQAKIDAAKNPFASKIGAAKVKTR
jgi:Ca2+-binding EF-hand superfamily protein